MLHLVGSINLKNKVMKYFNLKTVCGIETVDSIDRAEFSSYSEYKKELWGMLSNYRSIPYFSGVYLSQRCTEDWKS